MTQGTDGNLYGTYAFGGLYGSGTIFRMTTNGTMTTLVNLEFTNGFQPNAPPIQASDGNFYGTTSAGGDSSLGSGAGGGTIYKMTPDGILTTLLIFEETNGQGPFGCLVQANDGNLYGTCAFGGLYDNGTIFRMTTNGALTTLFNFHGTNGSRAITIFDSSSDGNFYGTTTEGGKGNYDDGTVFKVTPDGVLTTLVSFKGTNGTSPYGSLVQGNDGNLYGVTSEGGDLSSTSFGDGTVFRIAGLNLLPTVSVHRLDQWVLLIWSWDSVSNWTYRVQCKTNLTDTYWTDLPGDVLATNAVSGKIDPGFSPPRFYRLVLLH